MGIQYTWPASRFLHWFLGETCCSLLLSAPLSACLLQAHGKRSSFGVLKLSNGDVFEGIWSNDVRSGFGIMKFASGEEYKGGWLDNKFHGNVYRFV
jgi:hypothetical protein